MRGGEAIAKDAFAVGDSVVIKTDLGTDLGKIIRIEEEPDDKKEDKDSSLEPPEKASGSNFVLRKAGEDDLRKWEERNSRKEEVMKKCEDLAKKKKMPIKVIDTLFSFDGGRITFAFIAPSRVDFRDLVKDLVQEFHKSIRMYQVGARQEAGWIGDVGPCGRKLCCNSFLNKLGNVSVEMMLEQQLSQRGSDRLTGVCGRLKCCLSYEQEAYKELIGNLPPIGSEVKIKGKTRAKVVDWRVLKQAVVVEEGEKGKEGVQTEVPLVDIEFSQNKDKQNK